MKLNPTIMVVDDDANIRLMIRNMLSGLGYQILEAQDGGDALAQLKHAAVQLVICDIVMPEKEGIETINEIKHDYPEIKILAISGGGRISARSHLNTAKMVGADATLSKPFVRAELLSAIDELIRLKS